MYLMKRNKPMKDKQRERFNKHVIYIVKIALIFH